MQGVEALEARLSRLRESEAFRRYRYVRDVVLRLRDLEVHSDGEMSRPSEYWREELANFDYMLDASPLIIEKLRHHCYHITGLRVYDYRSHRDDARAKFEAKLEALKALDNTGVLVPEPRILGGFGFEIDGHLFNIDTLKFYEVLIALDRGAVLQQFRRSSTRGVVWEIGAGWGGFAYQFKTLCPNVTYIITDFPELFLFSAVYLMTAFPDARFRFADNVADGNLFEDWQASDFIFVPHTQLAGFTPPQLALTINMVSFQEMTTQQVDGYIRQAHELYCPTLYSLNRDRSPYNVELTSVREILTRYYWPHEIPVLPVGYTQMLDKAKDLKKRLKEASKVGGAKEDLGYKHIIGTRRIRV